MGRITTALALTAALSATGTACSPEKYDTAAHVTSSECPGLFEMHADPNDRGASYGERFIKLAMREAIDGDMASATDEANAIAEGINIGIDIPDDYVQEARQLQKDPKGTQLAYKAMCVASHGDSESATKILAAIANPKTRQHYQEDVEEQVVKNAVALVEADADFNYPFALHSIDVSNIDDEGTYTYVSARDAIEKVATEEAIKMVQKGDYIRASLLLRNGSVDDKGEVTRVQAHDQMEAYLNVEAIKAAKRGNHKLAAKIISWIDNEGQITEDSARASLAATK